MFTTLRNWFRFSVVFLLFTVLFYFVMDKIVMPLYVQHGKEYELIDVRNMISLEAEKILNNEGYLVEVVDSVQNLNIPLNTVIEQFPKPGTKVKNGRVVRLVVSKGESYFDMPNLVGKVYKAARLEVERRGLVLDTIHYEYSWDKPKDVITGQSLLPGERVSTNSLIELYVSYGPPEKKYKVPDLFGKNLEIAKRDIRKSGFKVGTIRHFPNNDLTPFTVIGQEPKAGKLFETIQAINLDVTTIEMEGN